MPAKNDQAYYDYIDLLGKEVEQRANTSHQASQPPKTPTFLVNLPPVNKQTEEQFVLYGTNA